MRINKSDQNDAKGLAEMARMGWYREERGELEGQVDAGGSNQIGRSAARSRQPNAWSVQGARNCARQAGSASLARKVDAVLAETPDLRDIFAPLLLAQSCLTEQIEKFDRQPLAVAKSDQTVRRMMTVPGIGPLTALSFVVTIDDPTHFRRSTDVGACLSRPDTKTLPIRRD